MTRTRRSRRLKPSGFDTLEGRDLLSLAASLPAAEVQAARHVRQTTYRAVFPATVSAGPTYPEVVLYGRGNSAGLGRFTFSAQLQEYDFHGSMLAMNGRGTLTTRNGSIDVTFNGDLSGRNGLSAGTVIGGTGRFAGAHGTFGARYVSFHRHGLVRFSVALTLTSP